MASSKTRWQNSGLIAAISRRVVSCSTPIVHGEFLNMRDLRYFHRKKLQRVRSGGLGVTLYIKTTYRFFRKCFPIFVIESPAVCPMALSCRKLVLLWETDDGFLGIKILFSMAWYPISPFLEMVHQTAVFGQWAFFMAFFWIGRAVIKHIVFINDPLVSKCVFSLKKSYIELILFEIYKILWCYNEKYNEGYNEGTKSNNG